MKTGKTTRGFNIAQFKDRYDTRCSLQKSSLATEDAIWFGVDDAEPRVMASELRAGGTGWVDVDLDGAVGAHVLLRTRMHLTQELVRELLPALQHFAETGDLP